MGDSWRVPLRNGYELVLIDTHDRAFLVTPSDGQAHHDLTRIGMTDRFVVVEDSGHFVLLEVRSRGESSLRTEAAFVPPFLVFLVFVWRFARFSFAGRVRAA